MMEKTRLSPIANIWTRAAGLADRTPASRNRYVDFLRAVSILMVAAGHWLVVAPYVEGGEFSPQIVLVSVPWTRWLTWLFQVMPVFFIVGGYANGLSWTGAARRRQSYPAWLSTRLQRLVRPILPLLIAWAGIAVLAKFLGAPSEMVKTASQFALLPTWFLVVYILVVILVPITWAAWKKWGFRSFLALALGALLVDGAVFLLGLATLGWLNYLFVWLAVHQLGYAWQEGRLDGPRRSLTLAVAGLMLLVLLISSGPYPVSMVTVPGEQVSNSLPPNLAMLALGVFQAGILLSLEPQARRWLSHRTIWIATVLVNGMIMTIFLWHITAMIAVTGLALALGGFGLGLEPGSPAWWASRLPWIGVLAAALLIFVMGLARFENRPKAQKIAIGRLISGAALVGIGLASLSLRGVSAEGWLGLHPAVALPFAGSVLLGLVGKRRAEG